MGYRLKAGKEGALRIMTSARYFSIACTLFITGGCEPEPVAMPDFLSQVDHLVYLTPDLDAGIEQIESLLGVRATPGGRHPEWGTRNALVSLGEATYLEILGPDSEVPEPEGGYPLGLGDLDAPRLATWAAKASDLERFAEDTRARGVELGPVSAGTRSRPDGVTLSWHLTSFSVPRADGVLPFFIDWGETPHPATTSVRCCRLIGLRAEHPDAGTVRRQLTAVGLALSVTDGEAPALIATIETPNGVVELR